jgi:hypothetical protein
MENYFFYNELPNHELSVSELLDKPNAFKRIPEDWLVVITDIKNSTSTVNEGLSEIVNLIATGSIIAALNIASEAKVDIPFFFGGDGATVLLPPLLLQETMAALIAHQSNVKEEFDIDLRVGSFPVFNIYEASNELKIAKVRVNALFSIPIVLGNGLQIAERYIKANYTTPDTLSKDNAALRLEGMECRWNKIPPPNNADEVVCLLVVALKESEQATVFKGVLDTIEAMYGPHTTRNPISIPKLKLNVRLHKIKNELRMRSLNYSIKELLKSWISTIIGKLWYLPSMAGQKYLAELVQLSDIFVLDGRINMVISGQPDQRIRLITFLEEEQKSGKLIYGIHVSEESIISCYVRNRNAEHIHFVDGGTGGYTKAASMLKVKLKNLR